MSMHKTTFVPGQLLRSVVHMEKSFLGKAVTTTGKARVTRAIYRPRLYSDLLNDI